MKPFLILFEIIEYQYIMSKIVVKQLSAVSFKTKFIQGFSDRKLFFDNMSFAFKSYAKVFLTQNV